MSRGQGGKTTSIRGPDIPLKVKLNPLGISLFL